MYLLARIEGRDRIAATLRQTAHLRDPDVARIAPAAHMEVWATSSTDDGEDYCEVRVFDAAHTCYYTRRIDGV